MSAEIFTQSVKRYLGNNAVVIGKMFLIDALRKISTSGLHVYSVLCDRKLAKLYRTSE